MVGSVPQPLSRPEETKVTFQSTETYRQHPAAGYGRRAGGYAMAGPAASIELTATEIRQLTTWVRAGTSPQRLVRRARVILGSAAGLGSRALARQEQMSRTTVRRWLSRFAARRCDGLQDRPRSGRPLAIQPSTRALVVALACERPADRHVPLSRYSLSELTLEAAHRLEAEAYAPSRSAIWRLLTRDALRPWRYRCWIYPRDAHFLERAGPVLDLYACQWQGRPLWADEYVLSADEKTSIQVRRRCHSSLPIGPHQAMRVEHEYERAGVRQYLAAWDVHRAVVFGRCEPKTGKAAFGRLVDDVMSQEPYRSARRVFWIVDNGSSHRGELAAEQLRQRYPNIAIVHTPTHASWLNQIEIYFSIIQRKVLTPNDYTSLDELEERIHAFGRRYTALQKPFAWRFTRQDLEQRMREPLLQSEPVTLATAA
jgi:transposase